MHGKKILRADIKLLNLVCFGVSSDTTHAGKTVQYTNHRRIESMYEGTRYTSYQVFHEKEDFVLDLNS